MKLLHIQRAKEGKKQNVREQEVLLWDLTEQKVKEQEVTEQGVQNGK